MGSSGSKPRKNEALILCKERTRYIKEVIDSWYALSAAHLSYSQSLRTVGTALRRFVEAEIVAESSLSTSEVDKSPTHSSYASPSPSRFPEHVGSLSLSESPLSPRLSNMSYMMTTDSAAVTVTINSSAADFVEEESLTFSLPPAAPPEISSSWDFFDPADAVDSAGVQNGENTPSLNFSRLMGLRQLKEAEVVPLLEEEARNSYRKKEQLKWGKADLEGINENARSVDLIQAKRDEGREVKIGCNSVNRSVEALTKIASSELDVSKMEKELHAEREDASEFITHRAKDFLPSMRDIEHRFLRAAEAGNEVSRMLETNKIRLGIFLETTGQPPASQLLSAFHHVCCKGETIPKLESTQHVAKVITWNRSISSLSSSSRTPLASAAKDGGDSSSDFIEEFSMISGSHSSTLDRLYAWERKLYDEVKGSECIRKAYDQKCSQLRHQSARDLNAKLIDRTRAVVKDLHSRIRVAIQSVDSISKRIERLRDEELHPQLVELIQGMIRMWKAMLECHHSQFITISLAYHMKNSAASPHSEPYRQALTHLQSELVCFCSSFANWVNAHKSYVGALNTWLQKCILQPKERRKGRKVGFPPRQALSPPIFVLCHDLLAGLASLPSEELCDSIKGIVSVLHDSFEQQMEGKQTGKNLENPENDGEFENNEDEKFRRASSLDNLQSSLTRLFDWFTKFSEASLKVYEDVKQGNEIARIAYTNGGLR
ncbi:protein ALTERED PHOSPHATE STARVATION RESPONSE 1-like [Phoenix dactylifera]|uniref:Protein ALTERED PHOSPHATE STARVATION RESPONSE 1-like n=1 Tax=Phoenix dactylifera TaxID=42345 RepID=A0A8B7CQ37_PHODC|nr:protein ALTERED PHOSPHATE STARVATION RESPONSE 1-like [Phoenix dactylifera]